MEDPPPVPGAVSTPVQLSPTWQARQNRVQTYRHRRASTGAEQLMRATLLSTAVEAVPQHLGSSYEQRAQAGHSNDTFSVASLTSSSMSLAGARRRLIQPELQTSFTNLHENSASSKPPLPTITTVSSPEEAHKKRKMKATENGGHFFSTFRHHSAAREDRRRRRLLDAVQLPLAVSELTRLLKKKHYIALLNQNGAGESVTPLIAAIAGNGGLEVIKLLVEKGANVDVKGPNGRHPLHWAALFGDRVREQWRTTAENKD